MRKDIKRYVKALLSAHKPITILWDMNEYDKEYFRQQLQNYKLTERGNQLTIDYELKYYKVNFNVEL